MAHAGLIADRTVQNEYRRFLRDRLFALGRPGGPRPLRSTPFRPAPGRPAAPAGILPGGLVPWIFGRVSQDGRTLDSASPMTGEVTPLPPRSADRLPQEVRLKVLLDHPFLIAEAIEEIVHFEFSDPELNHLRDAILQAEPVSAGLDAAAFQQHLCSIGFARSVNAILSPLVGYVGFLPPGSDPDTVRREWARINSVLADVDQEFRGSVVPEHSEETWEQAQVRIQHKLQAEAELSARDFSSDACDSG
jgi:hypothetical protein